jgi:predicted metal-dependent hydrolase
LETTTIQIEGIGKVKLTRRRNSRRVSLRIKTDGVLSVNYPWNVPLEEVLDFVKKNNQWIEEQGKKSISKKRVYQVGETIQTRDHIVEIKTMKNVKGHANIDKGKAVIVLPEPIVIEDEKNQQFIRKILAEVYRREAIGYLSKRVTELSLLHGLPFQRIFIKKLKSKWGSCSSTGNLNFNVYLMTLPDHLIDYIILHELAHTVEHNHSDRFWKLLNQLTNNQAKQYNNEISKNYRID